MTEFFTFESTFAAIWFWFTALLSLVWLKRHIDIAAAKRDPELCEADARSNDQPWPALTVLVAAKDEEANIAQCVEGLLRQDYPDLQVIVINDRSDDRTGAIIDELAQRDPRLEPIHVSELPEGWFGKNHAMHVGMEQARGTLLAMSDADCSYDSTLLLKAAVRVYERDSADFLSALPRLDAQSFWERVVQPVASGVMIYWFPPHKVNDPRSTIAYANGAFMLLSRSVYDQLGGHEPIKATLNEDMHFARRTKGLGLRLRVIRGGSMYRVRMYVGLQQIWRGWSRIFFGCFGTFPKLLASLLTLLIASLSPYVTLLLSFLAGADAPALALAAGLTILAQQSVLWRYYAISGLPAPMALTYPLGALICSGVVVNSMTRLTGRTTNWRGTHYSGGA